MALSGLVFFAADSGRTPAAPPRKCGVNDLLVPNCGAWWGVYMRDGHIKDHLLTMERRVGREFDMVSRYFDFTDESPGRFPDPAAREVATSRLMFLSWDTRDYVREKAFRWRDIASGAFDASVVVPQARRIKEFGRPMLLTFDHEMEMNVSPHGRDQGTEAEYVAAARHIRRVFDAQGVRNVRWVFTVTGHLGEGYPDRVRKLYPGDAYVDWVSWDPYNFYRCNGSDWETFDQSVGHTYRWMKTNISATKPYVLHEFGTQFDPRDPARSHQWYHDIPGALQKRYPSIRALVRWNSGFECGLGIDQGAGMLEAYAKTGRHPYLNRAAERRDLIRDPLGSESTRPSRPASPGATLDSTRFPPA
ncbi:glycosyl hydrolase family 26 [Thermomonospora umbrina]|uniref:Glycosyl hydrolase family 26 n=1 Tax=Thermomonospora umbrina TaxID=111806 RepID=A0A3D9SKB2_9ACTN|nr:glycosyl hydrolase family 26 [Thermomonospora umbrina]